MSNPPAGFYPDPSDPTRERWWDGETWTDHYQGQPTPARTPDSGAQSTFQYGRRAPTRQTLGIALIVMLLVSIALTAVVALNVIPQLAVRGGDSVSTSGVVTSVEKTTTRGGTGSRRSSGTSCFVNYSYDVNGTTYNGNSGMGSSMLCGYTQGQTITVLYKADDPGTSVLEGTGGLATNFIPVIMAALTWVFVVLIWRKRAKMTA